VFRVSAVDEIVNRAMLQYAQKTFNSKNCGMILVNNPWGESNEKGLMAALGAKGLKPAGVEKFEMNDVDVVPHLTRLKNAGADCLFLVGNVGPSAQVVKSLERMGWKPPIVSHWGPAGGRFSELAGPNAKEVHFIQTYSFFGKQSPVGDKVLKALMAKYSDIKGPGDVTPAVGVANAYDAMMLTALAIQNAGSTAGPAIREGYYKIGEYQGLIKNYAKPFTPDNHDAVNENDYVWTQFIDNQISGLSSVLNILYVLLALSVIVSLFGIVNTLVLTVFERTREIGMLRAVGMTRRQVRRMIRHESVITALIGAALGIVLGIVLAALLIARVDFLVFSFPTTQIIVFVIAAIVVGLVAAIFPARRAAKLDPLRAIAYE